MGKLVAVGTAAASEIGGAIVIGWAWFAAVMVLEVLILCLIAWIVSDDDRSKRAVNLIKAARWPR